VLRSSWECQNCLSQSSSLPLQTARQLASRPQIPKPPPSAAAQERASCFEGKYRHGSVPPSAVAKHRAAASEANRRAGSLAPSRPADLGAKRPPRRPKGGKGPRGKREKRWVEEEEEAREEEEEPTASELRKDAKERCEHRLEVFGDKQPR